MNSTPIIKRWLANYLKRPQTYVEFRNIKPKYRRLKQWVPQVGFCHLLQLLICPVYQLQHLASKLLRTQMTSRAMRIKIICTARQNGFQSDPNNTAISCPSSIYNHLCHNIVISEPPPRVIRKSLNSVFDQKKCTQTSQKVVY